MAAISGRGKGPALDFDQQSVGSRGDSEFEQDSIHGEFEGMPVEPGVNYSGIPATFIASFFEPDPAPFYGSYAEVPPRRAVPSGIDQFVTRETGVTRGEFEEGEEVRGEELEELAPPTPILERLPVRVIGSISVSALALLAIPEALVRTIVAVGQYAFDRLTGRGSEVVAYDSDDQEVTRATQDRNERLAVAMEPLAVARDMLSDTFARIAPETHHVLRQGIVEAERRFAEILPESVTAAPFSALAIFFDSVATALGQTGHPWIAKVILLPEAIFALATAVVAIPEAVVRIALTALRIIEPAKFDDEINKEFHYSELPQSGDTVPAPITLVDHREFEEEFAEEEELAPPATGVSFKEILSPGSVVVEHLMGVAHLVKHIFGANSGAVEYEAEEAL